VNRNYGAILAYFKSEFRLIFHRLEKGRILTKNHKKRSFIKLSQRYAMKE